MACDVLHLPARTVFNLQRLIDRVLLPPTIADMAAIAGLSTLLTAIGSAADINGTAGANIGPVDIHVTNSVIHLVDKVLLP